MATQKTLATKKSVADFLKAVDDEQQRKDSKELVKIFEEASGFKATMWGTAIVGFGSYHYKYESGHEGDSCLAGFSPRSATISLYLMGGVDELKPLIEKLGKIKMGKGCIYVKKLSDIDPTILKKLIKSSVSYLQKKYPTK